MQPTLTTPLLDREKYLAIRGSQGLSAALTALHHDKEALELQVFEGPDGYRPDLYALVLEYAAFSCELWDGAMNENVLAGHPYFGKHRIA